MDAIVIGPGYRHRRCVALALGLRWRETRNAQDKTLVSRRFTSKTLVRCSRAMRGFKSSDIAEFSM
jgi:hypothetical protein